MKTQRSYYSEEEVSSLIENEKLAKESELVNADVEIAEF